MTLLVGNAYSSSKLGALDVIHFGGTLARAVSEVERVEFVHLNTSGSKSASEIFIRSKFRSWADHPALGIALASSSDEKALAIGTGLASSPSFRFIPSGSHRLFTNMATASGGRNTPSGRGKSLGLVDVDYYKYAADVPFGANFTYFSLPGGGQVGNSKYSNNIEDLREVLSLAEAPRLDWVDPLVWDAYSDIERDASIAAGNRKGSELDVKRKLFHDANVVSVATMAEALALRTADEPKPMVLIEGDPYALCIKNFHSSLSYESLGENMLTPYQHFLLDATSYYVNPTGQYVIARRNALKMHDYIVDRLVAKGFTPTGFARFIPAFSTNSNEPEISYAFGNDRVNGFAFGNGSVQVTRAGTSLVIFGGFGIEVVGEHPHDIITVMPRDESRVVFEDEFNVRSYRSFFNGGVSRVDYTQQVSANIREFYLSSVTEPWFVGSPDPLAEIDLDQILWESETSTSPTGMYRLSPRSLATVAALGTPKYYLPLFAPLGGVDVLVRVKELTVGPYQVLAHHQYVVDDAIDVGEVVLDNVEDTSDVEPDMFDPDEGFSIKPDTELSDQDIVKLVEKTAIIEVVVDIEADRYCASVDSEWINTAATTGFGFHKPMNQEQLAKLSAFTTQFGGLNLAFSSYANKVKFPARIVEQTEIYKAYKKSRAKACKLNNFLKTKYVPRLTWGQAQDAVALQGSDYLIFGLFDKPSLVTPVIPIKATKVTYVYQVGTSPATLKRTVAGSPDFTVSDISMIDTVVGEIAGGATLSGISLPALLTSWNDGSSTANIESEIADLGNTHKDLISKSNAQRDGVGGNSLSWGSSSYSVNGFPLVEMLNYQDSLKAIIGSVNIYAAPGRAVKKAIERTGKSLIDPSAVAGRRLIARTLKPALLFDFPVADEETSGATP